MSPYRPPGWSTITPRLICSDVGGLVAFLKDVFAAEGTALSGRPTELKVGDSMLMISDGGGVREETHAFLHVYVKDADETYSRAKRAGAVTIEAPADMAWGDRRATVSDTWGNIWQIATYRQSR